VSVPTNDIRYLIIKEVRDWILTVSDLPVIVGRREEGRRARPDPPFIFVEMTDLGAPVESVVDLSLADGVGGGTRRRQSFLDARVQITGVGADARLDVEVLALAYGDCAADLRPIGGLVEVDVRLRDRVEAQVTQEFGVYYARQYDTPESRISGTVVPTVETS